MARPDVKFDDPSTWKNDDDLEYVRQRIDRVPAEHRQELLDRTEQPEPTLVPAGAAESVEINRLRDFLNANYADQMESGDTPVGVAIRLLSDGLEDDKSLSDENDEDPEYEKWKADELTAEIAKRRDAGREIPKVNNKAEAAAALRADDASR